MRQGPLFCTPSRSPRDRRSGDTGTMPDPRIPRIPDDWTVWAFADAHGVTSGLAAALQEAGIVDSDRHWIAPPRTALVGCGDYLDRGGDIRGLVELLQTLEREAPSHGGAVHLARGNHEIMPVMVRRGEHEWLETWLEYGGGATLAAYACDVADEMAPERLAPIIEACAPGLFEWLESLAEAVRWRDVLFVHGGLAPSHALADLGITTEEHLWVREGFFEADWSDDRFDSYRRAGIDRVVFGHTPQADGPTLYHEGRSLNIDTNAVGDPRRPDGAVQQLTLLRLRDDESLADARKIIIPTATAPDRMGA